MEIIDYSKSSLRKFAIVMAAACFVFAGFLFIRHHQVQISLVALALIFLSLGILLPLSLRLVYKGWMKFAFVLSWVNTRLILVAVFYLVFTPMGICLRLLGKDFLERKFDPLADTYWKKKERLAKTYTRQF
ncbi:MAG: sxtJ [Candidatus Omnitrophica bacterium]|nr:sxtJ [Candidatus Omnitrophota bacterium]